MGRDLPLCFFKEDIRQKRLYPLLEDAVIISAFALCDTSPGAGDVVWKREVGKALYLDRLGVNPKYAGKGIGRLMLAKAGERAKSLGAEYLRLFVVEINQPTVHLCLKQGFTKAADAYDEVIEENLVVHEYGYEMKL